jgi:IS605 OrfB family transposase
LHADTISEVCKTYDSSRCSKKKLWLKNRTKDSLGWIPFVHKCFRRKSDHVFNFLGKYYKIFGKQVLPETIRCGSFNQDSAGHWYVNLVCSVEESPSAGINSVGIDLGLIDLAVLSTGESFENPRYYRELEKKLGDAQRRKDKYLARRIHRRIKNKRKDNLHKISRKIVNENQLIVVGNVSSSQLSKNSNLGKSINDTGWGILKNMLNYKSHLAGNVRYLEVNESFTTQTCSSCSTRSGPKGRQGLGVREWVCCACGARHSRDVNAAPNILRLGLEVLESEGIQKLKLEVA